MLTNKKGNLEKTTRHSSQKVIYYMKPEWDVNDQSRHPLKGV